MTELRKKVMSRFTSCKKIDLKGEGLQFPKEYVVAVIQAMTDVYGLDESGPAIIKQILEDIRIEKDGEEISVKRGKGLGYFTNCVVLCIAATLDEFNVVQMFSDDILVDEKHFLKACDKLRYFAFILNDKKTGKKWEINPYFAGVTMTKQGSIGYWSKQSPMAAAMTSRFHHTRKGLLNEIVIPNREKVLFRYESIFGHEYRRGKYSIIKK